MAASAPLLPPTRPQTCSRTAQTAGSAGGHWEEWEALGARIHKHFCIMIKPTPEPGKLLDLRVITQFNDMESYILYI